MRDFLANHRTPETARAGPTTLAAIVHKAEDEDDDITSLGVMDELETRPWIEGELFRTEYIRLHGRCECGKHRRAWECVLSGGPHK